MELPLSKRKQLSHRRRRKALPDVPEVPESALQHQLEDTLAAYQVEYMRIPDGVWRWLRHNAPPYIVKALSDSFGGMPDCFARVPLDEPYYLCLGIELKSRRGTLHGKQKKWQSVVSRSTQESLDAVAGLLEKANKLKGGKDRNDEICPISSTGCASGRVVTICEGDNNCQHKGGK